MTQEANNSADSNNSDPAPSKQERLRVIYRGRVQGVGFRVQVLEMAENSPVEGFVRNRTDGSVELVCSGSATDLVSFQQAIRTRLARNIVSEQEEWAVARPGEFSKFRIAATL